MKKFNEFTNESKLQDGYREFFTSMLKVYGVKSPAEFKSTPEKGKKFYEDIKKGWSNGIGISDYGKKLLVDGIAEVTNESKDTDVETTIKLNKKALKKLEYISGQSFRKDFPNTLPDTQWMGAVLDFLDEIGY